MIVLFGVVAEEKVNETLWTRTGVELERQFNISGVPMRLSASGEWRHDFFVDPRETRVRFAAESLSWTTSGTKGSKDAGLLGAAFELGLGPRRSLRLYGEYEFRESVRVLHGGMTFSIGF